MERIRDDLGIGKTGTGHGTVRAPEILRDGVQSFEHAGNLLLDDALLPGPEDRNDLACIRVHEDALIVGMPQLDEPNLIYGEVPDASGIHPCLLQLSLVEVPDDVADGHVVHPGDARIGDGLFQGSDHGFQEGLGLLLISNDVKQPFGCGGFAVRAVVQGLEKPQDDVLGVVSRDGCAACLVAFDHRDDLPAMLATAFLGDGNPVKTDIVLVLVRGGDADLIDGEGHFAILCRMIA